MDEDFGEEEQFFDAREDVSSASGSCPSSPLIQNPYPDIHHVDYLDTQHSFWFEKLDSIKERRHQFRKWMEISSPQQGSANCDFEVTRDIGLAAGIDRITSDSGAMLRSSKSSSGCTMLSRFTKSSRIEKLDDDITLPVSYLQQDASFGRNLNVGSTEGAIGNEPPRILKPSSLIQHFLSRESNQPTNSRVSNHRIRKTCWLKRLGIASCSVNRQEVEENALCSINEPSVGRRTHRVKVHSQRKRSKEFSAVYTGQDIKAHQGAIRTLKFSHDGRYLASGGEDCIVRVWYVMESSCTGEGDFPDEDPSCMYFIANDKFQLNPISTDKASKSKSRGKRKHSYSACVVIPPDVFQMAEKPLHEFHGHGGDILDISWSKYKYLLSSSLDKTVRMWQVGCDNCIKVFSHTDYVTCVQFNPMVERYFISGSIDGKVRIWDTHACHVVEWIDIRDIVSAVSYHPNGKEIVVGSMMGNCRFYVISDNHLQLDASISLPGKRKIPKRITGFQFSPTDPNRLMVTSADSQIIILDGFDVVRKYKGLRNAGSQISASFTSDGRHIVAASEDSNVYIWNHFNESTTTKQVKSTWSSERFFSSNVSVAIPWMNCRNILPVTSEVFTSQRDVFRDLTGNHENHLTCNTNSCNYLCQLALGGLTLSQGFFSELLPKNSATWPEEKLVSSSMIRPSILCKSQHKFLRMCWQNMVTSPHAWGRVIVTAGWDGRIRSFCNYGLPVVT